MTRMMLLPRAAVALLLGAAAAACTDDPAPHRPAPPARTSAPTLAPAPTATSAAPVPSAPAVLTQDDAGRTVTLPLGGTAQLRFSGPWRKATPTVDGTAIVLVPVAYERDPGFRAWDIRAAAPGEAVLHATGQPGLRPLRITFRIR